MYDKGGTEGEEERGEEGGMEEEEDSSERTSTELISSSSSCFMRISLRLLARALRGCPRSIADAPCARKRTLCVARLAALAGVSRRTRELGATNLENLDILELVALDLVTRNFVLRRVFVGWGSGIARCDSRFLKRFSRIVVCAVRISVFSFSSAQNDSMGVGFFSIR